MLGRFLRASAAVLVAALVAVGSTVPAQAASGPAGDVYTILNQQRAANGLGPLMTDPTLDNAAWQWANYLATTGQFLHSSSEWRNSMIGGAGWINSGENIAAGYTSAQSVMTAWMGSAGHRANILNPNYVGVGVAYVAGGPYGHYWVQIFAASAGPRVPAGNAPTIAGGTTVGSTLTASTSGWPGGTTFGWQWFSDGTAISGATSTTYTTTISDAGRRITVAVTGRLSGYLPTTKTSAPTTALTGGPTVSRLSGADRYSAAAAISASAFAPGVAVVYVASGVNFPDAISAVPAAARYGSPLLLTEPGGLPAATRTEILRLRPARIVVAGGEASVSPAVFAALSAIAPTERAGGADRFDASRTIVSGAFESASVAYLSTGWNFPDALTAGAAAASLDAPVILVNGQAGGVDAPTLQLLRDLGVTSVRIAGGVNSVSPGIMSDLSHEGFSVQRIGGADRYEAAANINAGVFSSAPEVYLASGANFPDALAGSALAAFRGAPLYIATPGCIPEPIVKGMSALQPTKVVLLGGPASLSPAVATLQRC
ncbi:cell wall-binding repeat-containing protein [Salinibacterium soli]|uniref:Cell wall-binding repeat-containing protein n=1 Tax=Antiquaquibacter soli TaxID=3064523 RepID=A0ABT9BR89_9MICO|nr:cell wall-binding repeat-containing protein [Protaetiibacter sp. WY-16]MDO7883528.1 cell wall-binding repeat-containing protein [Protaetiibacter sp. WY-16]